MSSLGHRLIILLPAFTLGLASLAVVQERAPAPAIVRVLPSHGDWVVGTLSGDSVFALDSARADVVALADARRLQVQQGYRRYTGRGAAYGFVVALAISAIGTATGCDADKAVCFAGGTVLFSVVTVPIGALVGASSRTPRWIDVPLPLEPGAMERIPPN